MHLYFMLALVFLTPSLTWGQGEITAPPENEAALEEFEESWSEIEKMMEDMERSGDEMREHGQTKWLDQCTPILRKVRADAFSYCDCLYDNLPIAYGFSYSPFNLFLLSLTSGFYALENDLYGAELTDEKRRELFSLAVSAVEKCR